MSTVTFPSTLTPNTLADADQVQTLLNILRDTLNGNIDGSNVGDGTLSGAKLLNSSITSDKLAAGAVVESALGADAVVTTKIKNGAVTAAKLVDGAVTTVKLADEAVTTAKLVDDAVTGAKVATNTLGPSKLTQITGAGVLGRYQSTAQGNVSVLAPTAAGQALYNSDTGLVWGALPRSAQAVRTYSFSLNGSGSATNLPPTWTKSSTGVGNRASRITHNLGHTDYRVVATSVGALANGSAPKETAVPTVITKTSTYFDIFETYIDGGSGATDQRQMTGDVVVVILG